MLASRIFHIFAGLLLLAATIGIYSPAFHAGFIIDDRSHFLADPVMSDPKGWQRIWFDPSDHNDMWAYIPITRSSFWLEWQVWGYDLRAAHGINIVLHGLGALLLWGGLAYFRVRGAWLVAMIFACHPICVQSVAWISERKNVVSLLFYLLTFFSYLRFLQTPRTRWYVLSLLLFVMALLSKTSTVMLPVLLIFAQLWLWRTCSLREGLRLLPFFLIACLFGILRIYLEAEVAKATGEAFSHSLLERLLLAGHIPFFYLSKITFPYPLIFIYPKWEISAQQWTQYLPLLSVCLTMALLGWKYNHWGRPLFLAFGAFGVSLFPVLGFFDIGFHQHSFVTDYFVYLPSLPIFILLTFLILRSFEAVTQNMNGIKNSFPAVIRGSSWIFWASVFGLLSVLTWHQASIYESRETLWKHTLSFNPRAAAAHNNLGLFYEEQGATHAAYTHYNHAIANNSKFPEAYNNRSLIYVTLNQYEKALVDLNTAIELRPWDATYYLNRGGVYAYQGHYSEALTDFTQAIELRPDYLDAYKNRRQIYLALKQLQKAQADFKKIQQLSIRD